MASPQEIVTALAKTIADATDLLPYPWIVDDLEPPAVVVFVEDMTVGAMGLGQIDMTCTAVVLTARADDRSGTETMYAYLDPGADNPRSVWRSVFANPSLGVTGVSAMCRTMRGLSTEEVAGYGYFGASFEIVIVTSGA